MIAGIVLTLSLAVGQEAGGAPVPAPAAPLDEVRRLAPAAQLEALLGRLFDSKGDLHPRVARRLVELLRQNRELIATVTKRLDPEDATLTSPLVEILGRVGDRRATPRLVALLKSDHADIRLSVSRALRWLGDPATIPAAVRLLEDASPEVRRNAAQLLGRLGGASTVPPLVRALDDRNRQVRHEAARALGEIGDAASVDPLLAVARSSDDRFLRDLAGRAICKIDDPRAVQFMNQSYEEGSARVRAAALEGLARFRYEPGRFRSALADENPWIRQQALRIWARHHPGDARETVLSSLRSPEAALAREAARCLEDLDLSLATLIGLLGEPLAPPARECVFLATWRVAYPGRLPRPTRPRASR